MKLSINRQNDTDRKKPTSGRGRRTRLTVSACVLAAAVLVFVILHARSGAVPAERVTAEKRPLQDWYTENAVLRMGEDVTCIAEVSGSILEIPVREGETVKAGDLILRIDAQDYLYERELAQAARDGLRAQLDVQKASQVMTVSPQEYVSTLSQQLTSAQASLQAVKTVWDADQTLYGIGSISTAQYERDKAAYEAALAACEQAQQRYDESTKRLAEMNAQDGDDADRRFYEGETAQIEAQIAAQETLIRRLDDRIEKCGVRAECGGVVKNILVRDVSAVSAGTPLFTFSRREGKAGYAEADVLTSAAVYLHEGTPVRVRLRTRGDDRVLTGHVTEVHGYADRTASALGLEEYRVHVKAALDPLQDGGPAVPDGSGADMELLLFDRDDCIVVPSGAVYKKDGNYYVLKESGGRACAAPVSVLYSSGSEMAVSSGLEEGAVILNNIDREGIREGARVR